MRKRWLLLGLGLLMLLGANLRPAYRVSVGGERLPGLYTLREVLDCTEAAQAAAEEILDNSAPPPALRRSFRLSLRAADGDPVLLTDALLRATRGVTVSDAVIVNGTRIGTGLLLSVCIFVTDKARRPAAAAILLLAAAFCAL